MRTPRSNCALMTLLALTVILPGISATYADAIPGLRVSYYTLGAKHVGVFVNNTPVGSELFDRIEFAQSESPFWHGGMTYNFGVVFEGVLNLPWPGNYLFYTESDDGSVMYVDSELVVANDGGHGPARRGSAPIALAAGDHDVRVEYWQGPNSNEVIALIDPPDPHGYQQVIRNDPNLPHWVNGVQATYYNNRPPTQIPNLDQRTPYFSQIVADIDIPFADDAYFAGSGRGRSQLYESVAAVYQGLLRITDAGTYRLYVESDDGARLTIDGSEVLDNGGLHGCQERSRDFVLSAGDHTLRLDYFQYNAGRCLTLEISGGPIPMDKQRVPAGMLFHVPDSDCDNNGTEDAEQATIRLDVGDIVSGGNGTGNGELGKGVRAWDAHFIAPGVWGGNRPGGTASVFNPTDGQNGRALVPLVDGVFVPNGYTQISSTNLPFMFSTSWGGCNDAIRNGVGRVENNNAVSNIVALDRIGTSRPGLGMHANCGVTIDLDKIRAAIPPERRVTAFHALAASGLSYAGQNGFEVWVIVDGQLRFHGLLGYTANPYATVDLALSQSDRFLSLAVTDAGDSSGDHAVFADAVLLLNSEADANADGTLDLCAAANCIPCDTNCDGSINQFDIQPFIGALTSHAGCSPCAADANADGTTNQFDINAFLDCLIQ